ncbi:IclR family transcriptional regulator C-terminal domain-containing protein [Orbus sturtevantii]|uniref:IclR family transcriptional regulator domain-containing protein n=1 Tax=Orbus sturtevantii TaxID=3074109 RepID=UPI00370D55FC
MNKKSPLDVDETAVENDESRNSENFVRSFARGLDVIRSFNKERSLQTLAEIATNVNLARAGVRRLLFTLMSLGYVEKEGRFFRLTPKILELGFSYLAGVPFLEMAEPIVTKLVRDVEEGSSIAALDGYNIVYLLRVQTQKIMSLNLSVGSRLPAPLTALGRVLLSALDDEQLDKTLLNFIEDQKNNNLSKFEFEQLKLSILKVREQGWSIVNQEMEVGLIALAVPIFGKDKRVIAAINIFRISEGNHEERLKSYLPALLHAAEEISNLSSMKYKCY